jgi:hypothetical protein
MPAAPGSEPSWRSSSGEHPAARNRHSPLFVMGPQGQKALESALRFVKNPGGLAIPDCR